MDNTQQSYKRSASPIKALSLVFALMLVTTPVVAHEMTPTYPVFKPAYVEGIVKTTMRIFNKREDVEYYEIGVFDENWRAIPFVTSYKLYRIKHLGSAEFDLYVKSIDLNRVEYICSISKLKPKEGTNSLVQSKICSRVRKGNQ